MGNFIIGMINKIFEGLGDTGTTVLGLFPSSPFEAVEQLVIDNELLGGLAWIIPIQQITAVLSAWVTSIAIYYAYQVVLRWIKVID